MALSLAVQCFVLNKYQVCTVAHTIGTCERVQIQCMVESVVKHCYNVEGI